MSEPLPRPPSEIFDDIIDLLHDDRNTLKCCCLLSKSWIPRARRHLFRRIKIDGPSHLKAGRELFPDPAESPACHVRSLVIRGSDVQDAEESGWIRSFINVTDFTVFVAENSKLNFFHKFSPSIKCLHVYSASHPLSNIFALVCSFPFLEDLTVENSEPISSINQDDTAFRPSSSPPFNGTLMLKGYLEATATRMLNLPGGLNFKKIAWKSYSTEKEGPEFRRMATLMERCFHTLEYIDIDFYEPIRPPTIPIDLSKATKLKGVRMRLNIRHVTWMAEVLETIAPDSNKDLERIEIGLPWSLGHPSSWGTFGQEQCEGLDNILVRLWESRTVRTRFVGESNKKEKERDPSFLETVFPQMSKKLEIGLV